MTVLQFSKGVYSLEGLVAWLKTKDPTEPYDFMNCQGRCLIGQYLASAGLPWSEANYRKMRNFFLNLNGGGLDTSRRPYTFGNALARAEIIAGIK